MTAYGSQVEVNSGIMYYVRKPIFRSVDKPEIWTSVRSCIWLGLSPYDRIKSVFGLANYTSAEARHEFQRLLEHSMQRHLIRCYEPLKLNFRK
jgi:hypothetical protein